MTPNVDRRGRPRLPKQQLAILVICRLAEPIVLTSVYPYLPEMIESFNVPQNEVAKWAGIVSAMFSCAQCITGIPWGAVSDRWGRKPVIILSLTSTMIATVLWGLSSSLTMAIIVRAVSGANNGNVGTMRTVVAEMVPEKELQPQAFSIMPLVWTMGSIVGPAIGGALVYPAERYPGVFGNSTLFKKYPFLLPNLIGACIFAIGIATGVFFLKETLETKRNRRDYGRILGEKIINLFCGIGDQDTSTEEHPDSETEPLLVNAQPHTNGACINGDATGSIPTAPKASSQPPWSSIFTRQTSLNIFVYGTLAMHTLAFDQLIPVFMHYPYQSPKDPAVKLPFKFASGFGIDSSRIGLWLTLNAVFGVFAQFFVYPPIARRYGVLRCLRMVSLTFPLIYLITPFTVLLPHGVLQQIAVFAVLISKTMACVFAFPSSTIMLTNSVVSLRILGALNGVATTSSALGRAAGPALCGFTFSVGLKAGYVITAWWLMAGIAVVAAVPVFWVVEGKGHGHHSHGHAPAETLGADETLAGESEDSGYDSDRIDVIE